MYRPVQQNNIPVRGQLFSQKNFDTLNTILTQDFEKRLGKQLDNKQSNRLANTLDHYIKQIYSVQGDKPLQTLNKEILYNTSQDFNKYIQRKEITKETTAVKTVMDETLFQDTSQRFERLSQERNEIKSLPPAVPDFRVSLSEDGPSSIDLFEQAKKQRELEALRQAAATANTTLSSSANVAAAGEMAIQKYVKANDVFNNSQAAQNKLSELALYDRMIQKSNMVNDTPLAVMPDRREILMQPIGTLDAGTRELGMANSNVTIVQPLINDPTKNSLPQNVIIKEDSVVSYREIENNLFIYSADRDWLRNNKENRYNFTVNFDPANNGQSFGPSPSSQMKFKNIVRIELVKAIMPGEGLDVLVNKVDQDGPVVTTNYQDNILNFPYITVRVAELENNNYGTDNFLDRSFGVLQYDANWISDSNSTNTRGYVAMIPKFLKCQKEYYPTPLSTLQKMTIDIHRPNGELISQSPDTFNISGIVGSDWTGGGAAPYNVDFTPSVYYTAVGDPEYLFIRSDTYFSRFQINSGDRIVINGFSYNDVTLNDPIYGPQLREFVSWLNSNTGHIVAGVGYSDPVTGIYYDGPNSVGYANYIIIQSRFADPTTGATSVLPFGTTISTSLVDNSIALLSPRRLIDLNKQLSLVFRIITREMDALPQLRPDNNY